MSPDVPEMIDGWTLYVCPNGHVATSTLNLACWACYPGGRDALPTQKPVEVVPRSALDRQARETACDRCGDELRDHPGLRPVCGVCMLGTTEDDLYQQARRDVAREIVEALREAAHGGNRGQPGSFWVGWRAAARAIEGGWTEKPETDT